MIIDTANVLSASFETEGQNGEFAIIFKSRGGSGDAAINPDYMPGLKVLLSRLASIGAVMKDVTLDSGPARRAIALGEMSPDQLRIPETSGLVLANLDTDVLCNHISRQQKNINVAGAVEESDGKSSGGNGTRRIRIEICTPDIWSAGGLEKFLRYGHTLPDTLSMTLAVTDWREGFLSWHATLRTGDKVGKDSYYFPSENVRVKIGPRLIDGVPVTWFGIGKTGKDWVVEINPPSIPGEEYGLASVAIDSVGRRWLLRQGILHKNDLSHRIDRHFGDLTGLRPVDVKDTKRSWYPVELLERGVTRLPHGTLEFVKRCGFARMPAGAANASRAELFGAAEIAGSYILKASHRVEQEVTRKQGYVWEAFETIARQNDARLTKPRHAMGYEVDGLVDNAGEKFLLEIKTTVLAPDVYTGVGQLHLYDQLIPGVKGARKVLLLPGALGEEIKAAVSSTGIVVLAYDMRYHNDRLMITFPEETRLFFGFLPSAASQEEK
ncbi:hypothetical protein H9643_15395 [Ochrobactrum sp. Sa2BUA5]|nr:hypothetical protein [Ochrobactrum gallinarum]